MSTLPRGLGRLLIVNGIASIVFNYTTIFVNLYVWRVGASIFHLALYNLVLFAAWGSSNFVGTQCVTRWSIRIPMILSACSACIGFMLLSFHWPNYDLMVAMIAIPIGMFGGFYYSALNLSVSTFGNGPEFSKYFAYANLTAQVVAMLNPVLSAGVIDLFGFTGSFIIMIVIAGFMLAAAFVIPEIKLKREKLSSGLAWNRTFPTVPLRWLSIAIVIGGVFQQIQGTFALIFTFHVTQNNVWIALLNVGYTCATIVGLYLYQRVKIRAESWLWIGVLLVSLGLLVTLVAQGWYLVVSTLLTTVGLYYFSVVWGSEQFIVFQDLTPIEKCRMFTWRENLACWGRMIVLLCILPIHQFSGTRLYTLVAIGIVVSVLAPYIQNWAIRAHRNHSGGYSVSV